MILVKRLLKAKNVFAAAFVMCAVAFGQVSEEIQGLDRLSPEVRAQVKSQIDHAEHMRKSTNTKEISIQEAHQLLKKYNYAGKTAEKRAQMKRELAHLSGVPAIAKLCELGRSYCYDTFLMLGTPAQKASILARAEEIYLDLEGAVPANNYYRLRLQYDLANAHRKAPERRGMDATRAFFRAACIDVLRFPDSDYIGIYRTAKEQNRQQDLIGDLKREVRSKLQLHVEAMAFAYPETMQSLELIVNELPNDPLMRAWAGKKIIEAKRVYAERTRHVGFGLSPDSKTPGEESTQKAQDAQK